jgi:hypothetical protein
MLSVIVPPGNQAINRKNHKPPVNSAWRGRSRRIMEPFTAVPDRVDDLGLTRTQQSTYRVMLRIIRRCDGVCDWPKRRLAAECRVSESTLVRDIRSLKAKGLIVVEYRKVRTCNRWNDTNLYSLPVPLSEVGGGVKNEGEKQAEKDLKTTTPTRENPREAWEARKAQDREDSHRMRERYVAVGQTIEAEIQQRAAAREENRRFWREGSRHRWDGGREHRLSMAQERTRMHTQARVGMYTGESSWEERNPEENAWYERELAKQNGGMNGEGSHRKRAEQGQQAGGGSAGGADYRVCGGGAGTECDSWLSRGSGGVSGYGAGELRNRAAD